MEKRLLIVDDDVPLTRVVALTADTLGIRTVQVNDPTRALDSFVALRPQVVILDIFMPEQDGIDEDLLRLAQDAMIPWHVRGAGSRKAVQTRRVGLSVELILHLLREHVPVRRRDPPHASSSSSFFASCRLAVSRPSVNQA